MSPLPPIDMLSRCAQLYQMAAEDHHHPREEQLNCIGVCHRKSIHDEPFTADVNAESDDGAWWWSRVGQRWMDQSVHGCSAGDGAARVGVLELSRTLVSCFVQLSSTTMLNQFSPACSVEKQSESAEMQ